jgi:hypothetical protein
MCDSTSSARQRACAAGKFAGARIEVYTVAAQACRSSVDLALKREAIVNPLQPVVALMVLAAVLFFAAGPLDGAYPGGSGWVDRGAVGYLSYLFGALNLLVAAVIWRGSERGLLLRMALAAVFFVERLVSAFLFGPKSPESATVHVLTAIVEFAILVSSLGVWRLGHSVDSRDLSSLFALFPTPPAPTGPVAARGADPVHPPQRS